MKIYKNLWAGYDCYFVKTNSDKMYAYGFNVHNAHGKWEVSKGKRYISSLRDMEHYPIVGNIDLNKILIESVLEKVEGEKR